MFNHPYHHSLPFFEREELNCIQYTHQEHLPAKLCYLISFFSIYLIIPKFCLLFSSYSALSWRIYGLAHWSSWTKPASSVSITVYLKLRLVFAMFHPYLHDFHWPFNHLIIAWDLSATLQKNLWPLLTWFLLSITSKLAFSASNTFLK